jgi:hypothetical protein
MATARRVSLFSRRLTVRLSPMSSELLADATAVLSEGGFDGDRYAGSTMVTIDLARLGDRVSDPIDDRTARRLAELVPTDDGARGRVRRVALGEATRIAGCDLHAPSVDVRARAVGARVHLDLDLEADRRTP